MWPIRRFCFWLLYSIATKLFFLNLYIYRNDDSIYRNIDIDVSYRIVSYRRKDIDFLIYRDIFGIIISINTLPLALFMPYV